MKTLSYRHLFLPPIYLLCSTFIFGQVFPDMSLNPVWKLTTSGISTTNEIRISVGEADVVIDNQIWTELFEESLFTIGMLEDSVRSSAGFYKVFGSRVRYLDTITKASGLIYDFSLLKGDTSYVLPPNNFPIDSMRIVVENIDTVYCNNGRPRKEMLIKITEPGFPQYRMIWKEGVGRVAHPILPISCLGPDCDIIYDSNILTVNNTTIDLMSGNDCLVSVRSSPGINTAKISTFPNPVRSQYLFARSSMFESKEVDFTLISIMGREYALTNLIKIDPLTYRIDIDKSIDSQFYILRATSSGTIIGLQKLKIE
ncbi:hypothetical protein [Neolewinella agarilytica]|uniref:hypothetical protein n=1 Tax=Neolewinella agarilytica TaxID=478744 RepID=UPI0023538BCA|nr:hypothetical protein [Neolewinella agarilytica]